MVKTNYLWDEVSDNVIAEYESGVATAVYTQEPGLYGNLISQRRSGVSHFYHFDARGDTRNLTDASENVTDSKTYDGWGNVVVTTGSTATPFQFVGRKGYQNDLATRSTYLRARHYHPLRGRWASPDPLGYLDGINLYAYVTNNAIMTLDPSGTTFKDPTFNDQVTEDRRRQCSRMFLTAPEFFKLPEHEIQKRLLKCAAEVTLKDKIKCIAKVFGKGLSDAAKEQLMKYGCCVINKGDWPDPCHWGLIVPPGDPEGKDYPPWPVDQRDYCFKSKWPWKGVGDADCWRCCEYQTCIEGFKAIADYKEIIKRLRPGSDPFDYGECFTSCQLG